jgi:membrane-associated protease RseP (regulator of RpoE activity)
MAESVETIPGFQVPRPSHVAAKPTAREWVLHLALFLVTVVTTVLAGVFITLQDLDMVEPALSTPLDYVLFVPSYYAHFVIALVGATFSSPGALPNGIAFSASLLSILTAHEMGHYVACRRYGVSATLPYFLPAPPLFLAGTFGAFIKIKSPIPTRRALVDIGLAGPLAGFVAAIPIAVIGVRVIEPAFVGTEGPVIVFNDPLLFKFIAWVIKAPLGPDTLPNPYYMAAWIGLLVTSLNLMPVGQLDGGHGTFALFGAKYHRLIGWVAFFITGGLSILGLLWHGSSSGFLYTILLGIMLRVRHPQPEIQEPLGMFRTVIAVVTLLVFILSFSPFPITII